MAQLDAKEKEHHTAEFRQRDHIIECYSWIIKPYYRSDAQLFPDELIKLVKLYNGIEVLEQFHLSTFSFYADVM